MSGTSSPPCTVQLYRAQTTIATISNNIDLSINGISSLRICTAHRYRVQTIAMISNNIDLSMIGISSSTIRIAHLYRAQTIMTPVAHTQPMTSGRTMARRTGGASQITDDVSERENTLVQLRRDLDRLLQQKSSDDHNNKDPSMNGTGSSTICTAHLYRAQTIMDRAKTIMTPVAQPMTSGRTTHAAPAVPPRSPTRSASVTTGWRN